MGQPEGGIPAWFRKIVLKGEKPIEGRPGAQLPPVEWKKIGEEVRAFFPDAKDEDEHVFISYAMYPKVYEDFVRHRQEYGYIMRMGSHVFFNGMAVGEVNQINIEDGKTLVIKYVGLGDMNEDGTRNVLFELNGMRREVAVVDPFAKETGSAVVLADPADDRQIGASIPGMISRVDVKPGDEVDANQVLAVVEAMKMETSVVAPRSGVVDQVLVRKGSTVKAGELLITLA